jgi:4-alpha-glucanotransferase
MTPRASGLLLHPTSLPSRFGIGDLGPEAHRFVDQLARAKQRVWQVLPLGPTGYGDSPYQSLSAFAGNPLLISLDILIADGLLTEADAGERFADGGVDYASVVAHRRRLWPRVVERFDAAARPDTLARFEAFCVRERWWLDDFALYIALKDAHAEAAWTAWPEAAAQREPQALAAWRRQLAREIRTCQLTQFLFFEQWRDLRARCAARGIALVGDVPIFVALDSADVWSRRDLFRLDSLGRPTVVAGVPPDYFSATGQLWGNPHYDWAALAREGFAWWIDRVRSALALVDRIRLDHFRGFIGAWEVPAGAPTAIDGRWQPGPGAALFEALQAALGVARLPLIAENLGVITAEVETVRQRFALPGMAILQFAFGTDPQAPSFRPHNHERALAVYTGTHDNDTTVGWWTSGDTGLSTRSADDIARERAYARRYLAMDAGDAIQWAMIRAAMASVAELAVFPVQDVLGLGNEARMNQPGVASGNWRWRLTPGALDDRALDRLGELTITYERA